VFVEAERSLNSGTAIAAALADLSFCAQLPRGGLSASIRMADYVRVSTTDTHRQLSYSRALIVSTLRIAETMRHYRQGRYSCINLANELASSIVFTRSSSARFTLVTIGIIYLDPVWKPRSLFVS